jgi:hypothetical protein
LLSGLFSNAENGQGRLIAQRAHRGDQKFLKTTAAATAAALAKVIFLLFLLKALALGG